MTAFPRDELEEMLRAPLLLSQRGGELLAAGDVTGAHTPNTPVVSAGSIASRAAIERIASAALT